MNDAAEFGSSVSSPAGTLPSRFSRPQMSRQSRLPPGSAPLPSSSRSARRSAPCCQDGLRSIHRPTATSARPGMVERNGIALTPGKSESAAE